TDKKIVKVFINESDIDKIKLGQKVDIDIDSIKDIKLIGEIVDIDILPTNDSGVITYGARVAINSTDERLKIGLTANINIILKKVENVLVISSSAIKKDKEGQYVLIVKNLNNTKNNITMNVVDTITDKVYIDTGLAIGDNVEIVDGVNEGDYIVNKTISAKENSLNAPGLSNILSGNTRPTGAGQNRAGGVNGSRN
ncbi:MAG: HlyD family efflux transporter periplasmic adaptor subunit, partial [Cyanobium sp. MAG06]|nr:HlyD family efflux transporter periplasmic adaptor subunit [Cyanobium sp. MAG06]